LRYPNVVFEFIGAWPDGLDSTDRIRFFPHLTDYKDYIRFQLGRRWKIGLAPLLDHEANRAKTDNKYREYSAFRCAGIYSAIPPYTDVVVNSVTGFLVENNEMAWLEALTDMLENSAKREAIAQHAFEDVRTRYDIQQVSAQWADLFLKLASDLPADTKEIDDLRLKYSRLEAVVFRLWLHIDIINKQGGWKLVIKSTLRKLARYIRRQDILSRVRD
jgi:glycosyltransferase involved in cell wall biosynthesis